MGILIYKTVYGMSKQYYMVWAFTFQKAEFIWTVPFKTLFIKEPSKEEQMKTLQDKVVLMKTLKYKVVLMKTLKDKLVLMKALQDKVVLMKTLQDK